MSPEPKNLEEAILHAGFQTRPELDARILDRATALLSARPHAPLAMPLWRRIVSNRWTKRSAAAASIAAAIILAFVLTTFSQPTYALSDTQNAMRAIKSVHIRVDPAGEGIGEAWAVFTDDHELLKLRMDFPKTEDGPKVVLWEKDEAKVWFKKKNSVAILSEKDMVERLGGFFEMIDPKPTVEAMVNAAGPDVTIDRPDEKDKPIVITRTDEGRPIVIYVNQKTRLVERIEHYKMVDGQRELTGRCDYSEYDAVDPKVFTPELPKDAIRMDATAKDVGIGEGRPERQRDRQEGRQRVRRCGHRP